MNCFDKQEPCENGHTIGRDARGRCIQCNRDDNRKRANRKRATNLLYSRGPLGKGKPDR